MDYLPQARTLLHRAKDTNDVTEKMTHLNTAAEMLAKLVDELVRSRPTNLSGLSRQEEDVLALLQDRGSKPGHPVPVQSLLAAWGTRGPESELFAALKKLELKGLLANGPAETGYELTEVGSLRP